MHLKYLGFNNWFQSKIDPAKGEQFKFARIVAVHKDRYVIQNETDPVWAEITGRLMFTASSSLDYPTVGDWVYAQYLDGDRWAIIHDLFPRKSVLKRKTAGKRTEYQLIAANIDTALIIQSIDTDYNPRRLERYLAMVNESRIHPVLLLSKKDLVSETTVADKVNQTSTLFPDLQTLAFSNRDPAESSRVADLFAGAKTYCLLGSSGVGKTTLLNHLLGEAKLVTREVRARDGKGKHATTSRQLFVLANGAMVIDTPGMRELGNIGIDSGIEQTFDDITSLSGRCRYGDCQHLHESGCAVLDAVANGKLSTARYRNYIKLRKESAHHERSYLDKRRADKKFGKMVKSVMKHHEKK